MCSIRTHPTHLCFVPPLLPDELLHSWLGRLSVLNSWGRGRDAVRKIFGGTTTQIGIDLPTHLGSLQDNLGEWFPCSSLIELIDVATILPYHRPFLEVARYEQALEVMRDGNPLVLKAQLGLAANRFGTKPALRFCPKCVEEDIQEFSCFYWHRQHHLPAVTCCVRHETRLQYYGQSIGISQAIAYPGFPISAEIRTPINREQLNFARLSTSLLSAKMPPTDAIVRSNTYRKEILARGYCTRGHIAYLDLITALRQRFEDFEAFDCRARLMSTEAHPVGWLRDLIERPQRSLHPICHILLIDFLFGDIANYRKAIKTQATFAQNKSFPCAVTAQQKPPHECGMDSALGDLLQDLSLSCREVARHTGKCTSTIVSLRNQRAIYVSMRPKTLDSKRVQSIISELSSNQTIADVAQHAGISLKSVYRILERNRSIERDRKNNLFSQKKCTRRCRWLSLLQGGEYTISGAKHENPGDYAWLYKNDREWLLQVNSSRKAKRATSRSANLIVRDATLSTQARVIARATLELSPPTRVSASRILHTLGLSRLSLRNLPKLSQTLKILAESSIEFKKRRIDFAIAKLGKYAPLWRVKRVAGLRIWPSEILDYAEKRILEFIKINPPPS